MRLEDLEVFRAVHETGSFQRAGLRTGLSQSAVTKVVRRLEEEFGLQLLERGSRAVALTPAGRALYQRSIEFAELATRTRQDLKGEAAALRGSLRLGVVPALLNSVAVPVLADLLSSSHSIQMHLSVEASADLVRLVEDGKLDMAVCFGVQHLPTAVNRMVVGRQRYRIVARATHPLVGRKPTIEDLAGLRWLLPSQDATLRAQIDKVFAEAGLAPLDVRIETDTSATLLLQLLAQTDLVAVMSEQKLLPLSRHGLATLDVDLSALVGDVIICYRRLSPAAGLLMHVRERLSAQVRKNFTD